MTHPSAFDWLRHALLLAAFSALHAAHATVFTIAHGDVTALKNAINTANTNGQNDTINLAADGTYTLTTVDNVTTGDTGLPIIGSDGGHALTLNGNGATLTRDAASDTPEFRILQVGSGANVTLAGLTISNGKATSGAFPASCGGGILNHDGGTLTVTNCTLSGNRGGSDFADEFPGGGGIFNSGALTVNNSAFNGNSALCGGGIENHSGTLTLSNCTLSGNSADFGGGSGGGLFNIFSVGLVRVKNSTLSSNTAYRGGGIFNGHSGDASSLTVENSVISGNSDNIGGGGGIFNNSTLKVQNSTIRDNMSSQALADGGGIYNNGGTLAVMGSTLSGNSAAGRGGAIVNVSMLTVTGSTLSGNYSAGGGGAIYSLGTLTVMGSTLSGNYSAGRGGAIHNGLGSLTLTHSTLSGNHSAMDGGGLCCDLTIGIVQFCTLSGNGATKNGGGIANVCEVDGDASLMVQNSTLAGNNAHGGGGLYNYGFGNGSVARLTVRNSTLSGNIAQSGGGLLNVNFGKVTVTSSTFSANTAVSAGGGIYNDGTPNGFPDVTLGNTLFKRGMFSANLFNNVGSYTSQGYNLSDDDATVFLTQATDLNNTDPWLGPLQDNGGPTFTHALRRGSPAIDQGRRFGLSTDQRGQPRPSDLPGIPNASDGSDIGAFERSNGDFVTALRINDVTVTEGNAGIVNAVFTVTRSGDTTGTSSVHYATANGTATVGSDYTAVSGTRTFSPGQTTKTIAVAVKGDTVDEANETFKLKLSSPSGATIVDGLGVGTIIDDDPLPVLSISNAPDKPEGPAQGAPGGSHNALFVVTLTGATARTVTVNYATGGGTATADSDYTAATGTLTFLPGQTSKTMPIQVLGDATVEPDETFKVNLGGATFATITDGQGSHIITNDDAAE